MPFRLIADAGAQTTISLALTSSATSFVGVSTANFSAPQNFGNGQGSLTILDAGNPAWNAAAPLATPYEYAYFTNNNTGTNTISGLTRGVAGTTAHAFFAGAIVAQGLLAEDIVASAAWKFDEQLLAGTATSITIPASGSIPSAYLGVNFRHIQIEFCCTATTSAGPVTLSMRYNGDNGNNYVYNGMDATGSSLTSVGLTSNVASLRVGALPGSNTSGNEAAGTITVYNFVATNPRRAFTSVTWRDDSNGVGLESLSGLWLNTSNPVTSVTLFPGSGSFSANSLFTTRLLP